MPRPVPDRPLTVLDLLDGSLNIAKLRPKTVAVIVLTFVLPGQLIAAWLQREAFVDFDIESFDSGGGVGVFGTSDSEAALATIIPFVTLPMIGVALTYLVAGWHMGEDRSPSRCLAFTAKKIPSILVAFVVCKVIQLIGFVILVVPGVVATALLLVVAPAMAAENLGPFAAIGRSISLGRRRTGPLMGLLVSVVVVSTLLTYALNVLPILAAALLGSWGWIAFFALGLISTSVLTTFAVGAAVLVYFDLINRTEGYDIKRRLDAITSHRGL